MDTLASNDALWIYMGEPVWKNEHGYFWRYCEGYFDSLQEAQRDIDNWHCEKYDEEEQREYERCNPNWTITNRY